MDDEETIFVCVWMFDHSSDQMLGFMLNEILHTDSLANIQSSSLMEQIGMKRFKMAAVIFI